ncbi:MAG: alpha/beta hydrolase [Gammaproteobacteria bacterium]|nr:alpha/beta hydrolase [Gammaproteobacteria bacterium]
MVVEPSLPTHTVYRPQTLPEAAEGALPIVAWANGACVNYGNRFRYFLTEIASHGYLAVAIGPPGSPALESTPALPPVIGQSADPAERTPPTHAVQLIDAIDWAIAQNSEPGSPYFRRLDTSKIAVMGQSCGGLQAIVAAADPRVTTTMIWNSGTFEGRDGLPGAPATRASLAGFHGPVAYISGDESDVAFKNSEADFELIDQVPVFRAWKNGVGHSGTYREAAGGAFAPVAIAWLDWHLKGRLQQAAMFVGRECALCTMPQWQVKTRGFEVFEGLGSAR